jgi:hypothetical protein
MKKKLIVMPKFSNEGQEADWWASRDGRRLVKQKAAGTGKKGDAPKGSGLVGQLTKVPSVQIALRLPEADVVQARELDARKGIGYQTLLKMLVHEGFGGKRAGCEGLAATDQQKRGLSSFRPTPSIITLCCMEAGATKWHRASRSTYRLSNSPELNPIGRVWKLTRQSCLHNRYFSQLSEMIEGVENQFNQWHRRNATLKRLCATI